LLKEDPLTSNTPETQTRSIPFGRPWLDATDRQAVMRVLDGHILTHGPECAEFELEFGAFIGASAHCVTMSSCAAALHLAYVALGVEPGDEVILPSQTHAATANTAEWAGATCVFVDCQPETGNMTADLIEAAITPRTKAVTVVHFLGIPCAMDEIAELARDRGIALIEDCALAVGARRDDTHVGMFGDAGCFSFYPVKHITTAEGGMFVTRHPELAERVAKLRAHGVDRTHSERDVPGMYDVPSIGLNYRLSEPQAALGRAQLRRISANLGRRKANFETIKDAVKGLDDVRVLDGPGNSHYCLTVVLEGSLGERRAEVVSGLTAAGVGTSLYYPQPVPRMGYYREKYAFEASAFPNAVAISDRSIALPVGPHLDDGDAAYIGATLRPMLEEMA
jgi:dTDP-4-amino-4,6-dideoxygalactose transaminase